MKKRYLVLKNKTQIGNDLTVMVAMRFVEDENGIELDGPDCPISISARGLNVGATNKAILLMNISQLRAVRDTIDASLREYKEEINE